MHREKKNRQIKTRRQSIKEIEIDTDTDRDGDKQRDREVNGLRQKQKKGRE